jgi:hypothetical protein
MGRRLRVGADGRFFLRDTVGDLAAFGIAAHPSTQESDAE